MSDLHEVFDTIEPLLDSDLAAAIVRVNKKTLQRHARKGLVVGLRVGKLWRFRRSDLDGWARGSGTTCIDAEPRPRYPVLTHSCPQPEEE